jgi:hypothetical protein
MIGYEHTGVRNIIQCVLLGHLLHTILYNNPPLPTGSPTVSDAGVLVRKLRQLTPLS